MPAHGWLNPGPAVILLIMMTALKSLPLQMMWWPTLLGLLTGLAAGGVFTSRPALARDAAGVPVWDVARDQRTTLAAALVRSVNARLVTVGELHSRADHHLAQAAVIRAWAGAGVPVAVGLEMWRRPNQALLDDWIAGRMDEAAMAAHFADNWGPDWAIYREIFLACREAGLDMVALNLPRETIRKIARQGYDSLTEDERGLLPPLECDLDPEYKAYLQQVFEGHGGRGKAGQGDQPAAKPHGRKGGPKPSADHGRKFKAKHGMSASFENFCQAQVAWDAGMAAHALDYLTRHPEKTIIVVAGMAHAARPGIPAQAARQNPAVISVVFQPAVEDKTEVEGVTTAQADYLLLETGRIFGGGDAQPGEDNGPF